MRTNLARKISAKAFRKSASAYKFFYMLCKTMVFSAIFVWKKRRKPFVYGLSPLRYYKDNTFLREMQIHLTYCNTLRNVKRRVLHTWGLAMCYITRRPAGSGSEPPFRPAPFGQPFQIITKEFSPISWSFQKECVILQRHLTMHTTFVPWCNG